MKILLLSLLLPLTALADEAACFQTGKGCAEVDLDSARAEAAYRRGCEANDSYACSRLGQLFEVKRSDRENAASFYDKGCQGGDEFGCGEAKAIRPRLCFIEKKKKFCDGKSPSGDWRAYQFLSTLDPKYADGFRKHDFQIPFDPKEVEDLFRKRMKEKNKKLLRALEKEFHSRKHDGADGESLNYYVECLRKECPLGEAFD